jgi:hypothetical protein
MESKIRYFTIEWKGKYFDVREMKDVRNRRYCKPENIVIHNRDRMKCLETKCEGEYFDPRERTYVRNARITNGGT